MNDRNTVYEKEDNGEVRFGDVDGGWLVGWGVERQE